MFWDNAYEKEPRKRRVYVACCESIWLMYPRYQISSDIRNSVSQKEMEEIWKRAKKSMRQFD